MFRIDVFSEMCSLTSKPMLVSHSVCQSPHRGSLDMSAVLSDMYGSRCQCQQATLSATLERIIFVPEVPELPAAVYITSVHDDKFLVSYEGSTNVYVYDMAGCHLSTVAIPEGRLFDVTWTLSGHIVYTTCDNRQVVLMSHRGDFIAKTTLTDPRCFSVASDGVIYLADWLNGIFKSTDGGLTWSHVFKLPEDRQCLQVVRVKSERACEFWVLEKFAVYSRVRVYYVDTEEGMEVVTWRDVSLLTPRGTRVVPSWNSRLTYDSDKHILLTEHDNPAVHVLSTCCLSYQRQLLTGDDISSPFCLASDKQSKNIYLGPGKGVVKVFTLAC